MADVFYNILHERAMLDPAVQAIRKVDYACGKAGYRQLMAPYARTDLARNAICQLFLEKSTSDDDWLVMLDCDHAHPQDIVTRLTNMEEKEYHQMGVVGALAFRRSEPYEPLFFIRDQYKVLRAPAEFEIGPVYQCHVVSTSAIAIRHWVFTKLAAHGYAWPWFQYKYVPGLPSEDMYFAEICENSGISHFCDTSTIIPHLIWDWVDLEKFQTYLKAHTSLVEPIEGATMKTYRVEPDEETPHIEKVPAIHKMAGVAG